MNTRTLGRDLHVSALGLGCATQTQLALAWLLAQEPWIGPIRGTTKLHRLEENLGADRVTPSRDDLRDIEIAASAVDARGARYPDHLEKLVDR